MPERDGALRIAVASGKGGMGKTIVATNLAVTIADSGQAVTCLDCDVEAPNAHLFLHPIIARRDAVTIACPLVDEAACTRCGRCAEVCQFHAILCLGNAVLTFPELCRGCGACRLVCPEKAIEETPREIGEVEEGHAGQIRFVQGRLQVGSPIVPPVIRAVKARLPSEGVRPRRAAGVGGAGRGPRLLARDARGWPSSGPRGPERSLGASSRSWGGCWHRWITRASRPS